MATRIVDYPPAVGRAFLDRGWVIATALHHSADGEEEHTDQYAVLCSGCIAGKRYGGEQWHTTQFDYTVLIVQRLWTPAADLAEEDAVGEVTDEWKILYEHCFRGYNAFERALHGELEPEGRWAYQRKEPRRWIAGYLNCLENAEQ